MDSILTAFNVNIVGRRRHDYGLINQRMDLMMIISTLQTNLSMQETEQQMLVKKKYTVNFIPFQAK